ncbi:agmatine deiminase [Anaerosacchariphilus polymeriproducens]|uniref:Putative agmatine deiminase n=1 Tax=Anaerosacchariphilus polymeriproducens TaxID=1812858 RepID=A0A371AW65_9FIRM|nr:agmatine deiminase [Anaerosacchariphilus polymeriproducens]RDU23782.1 agmatine deiminase [Anaerosacchariphilus polymeriproducens]
MNILQTKPKDDGYYMPAEFAPHYGCIIIWPERADSWQYGAVEARKAFVKVAEAISRSEKVTVCTSFEQYETARQMLPPQIRVIEMSSDDSWARDYMPTFVIDGKGGIRGIDWYFNAWGGLVDGLYFPWDRDNKMARKFCDLMEIDVYNARDFVLEGGSIHVDGEGTALVTEACLLSKGRNPELSKEQITEKLKDYLGVEKVIWLKHGIYRDETNEHIDNICAFTAPGEVVLAWNEDVNDPQYKMSLDCLNILEGETDARGRKLKVHKLPLPKPVLVGEECEGLIDFDGEPTRVEGERLAASYVNFYIANKAVIMPGFQDPADEKAKAVLEGLFPEREVIQIDARDILIGGGNIHCITQQIPAFKHKSEQKQ